MKTNSLLLVFTTLLAGCQAAPAPKPRPQSAPAPTAAVAPPQATGMRAPEVVKSYTIGAYVDPDDPTLRHEAHTVQRIEAVAYWDLRPAVETALAVSPQQTKSEPAPSVAPARPQPAAVLTPPPELSVDPEPALMPNADGLIDLTSADVPANGEVNPFAVRSVPAQPPREIKLRLTGILAGAKPCAIINGQLVEPGATVEGLVLKHIEPNAIILTLGRHRIRAAISAEPIRVRTTP